MAEFSASTLTKFEDASASIPLRPLCRAFDAVHIPRGPDPFSGGTFVPTAGGTASFEVSDAGDLSTFGERTKRLALLANDAPGEAAAGAVQLVDSLCRTIARRLDASPKTSEGLEIVANATLEALGITSAPGLEHLIAYLASSGKRRKSASPAGARLTARVAVALATFLADEYVLCTGSRGRSDR